MQEHIAGEVEIFVAYAQHSITISTRCLVNKVVHSEFSYESLGERVLKIGPHLLKLLSNIKRLIFFRFFVKSCCKIKVKSTDYKCLCFYSPWKESEQIKPIKTINCSIAVAMLRQRSVNHCRSVGTTIKEPFINMNACRPLQSLPHNCCNTWLNQLYMLTVTGNRGLRDVDHAPFLSASLFFSKRGAY